MIKNERQYRITKAQAEKFDLALREMESAAPEPDVHPVLHQAQIDSLRGQLQELRQELLEYEALRSGKRNTVRLESFDDLGLALIRARIASGMTQEELAGKLGLKPQQVQRYEATDYRSANLERIREVADVLGMKLREGVELPVGKS